MSIQKITQKEILENGVKSLPTRPSTPSLYGGSILSAAELKDAFDKLPTLIAERFNALLASTGLFDGEHPCDSFAETVATGLFSSHSLKDFFEDVKNGNLALYLSANAEGTPLADLLSELKRSIESKKSYTVSVEGDGDLVTDVCLAGEHLTLTRGATRESIVNEAKAYTDAPKGTVEKDSTTPVSGGAVHAAIKKESDKQNRRIANLENAAKDVLYTYPIEKEAFVFKRCSDRVLANAAVRQLGAVPLKNYNLFPEHLLYDFKSDSLTITWDDTEKVLVFNGTLHASESAFAITPFWVPPTDNGYFSCGVFYRGGSVSTEKAELRIVAFANEFVSLPLGTEDFTLNSESFRFVQNFREISIKASEDTVFDNYRINFLISHEQPIVHYEPHVAQNRFIVPKKLVSLGPNLWNGASVVEGDTYVSLPPSCFSETGAYYFGLNIQTTSPGGDVNIMVFSGDEVVYKRSTRQNFFYTFRVFATNPLTEIRVHAAKTAESSIGHRVRVKDIYVYPADSDFEDSPDYTPYHRDEIEFPDSFDRFADRFLGFDEENCNYFDFESGCFVDGYDTLRIDSTVEFEEEDSVIGRFSAPFAVPAALQSGSLGYQPSSVFKTPSSSPDYEHLWFTSDRVFVQSKIFKGKDAAAINRFFALSPIDVVYKKSTAQEVWLAEEEKALVETPTIQIMPYSYLCFYTGDGTLTRACAEIQYQIKQTEETTE